MANQPMIDDREFGSPEALLLVARSIAGVIAEHIINQGLTDEEATPAAQNLTQDIIAGLKIDLDRRNSWHRQIAIYHEQLGGHTHLSIFTGFGYGSRGKAGTITVRNEEWQQMVFALRLVEVILPGVFIIAPADRAEDPKHQRRVIETAEEDDNWLDIVVGNSVDIDTTEKAALTMMRWGLRGYRKAQADLDAGRRELEDFVEGS